MYMANKTMSNAEYVAKYRGRKVISPYIDSEGIITRYNAIAGTIIVVGVNGKEYRFAIQASIQLVDDPDDCLDCGAKGEEQCKGDCPNKEAGK
jgi:hypothetical protein